MKQELTTDIKYKVIQHRNMFKTIINGRYRELMPYLITYDSNVDTIDFILLETMLRQGLRVVIGETKNKTLQILGYTQVEKYDFKDLKKTLRRRLTKKDIKFIIDDHVLLDDYMEIIRDNDCKDGNFVVVDNKNMNLISDMSILDFYSDELSEINCSRYSIILQMKVNTFFIGDKNNETINQLVSDIYNGSPYIKVSEYFDKEDNIYTMENSVLSSSMESLKKEYQNKLAELNTMLGLNTLAVEKESGVSHAEATGNTNYSRANSNLYLSAREIAFNMLNKRYNVEIKPLFNNNVRQEMLSIGGTLDEDLTNNK